MTGCRGSASTAELDRIAMALPDVTRGQTRSGAAEYLVRKRTFVRFREPRPDAVDASGIRLTDVIMFSTADEHEKQALVQDAALPFFTTAHFDGYPAVLVREADLQRVPVDVLEEVVTGAWLASAPKRLAAQWIAERDRNG